MPAYLVETFLAKGDAVALTGHGRRAHSAAARLTRAGTRVLFEGAILVPGDETCFFIFDAASGSHAALAARQAELDPLRVVEAITFGKDSESDEAEAG